MKGATPVGLISPLPPQLGGVTTIAEWLLRHELDIGCSYVVFDLERPVDQAGGRFGIRVLGNQLRLFARFLPWARRAPKVIHFMISPTLTGLSRDVAYLVVLKCAGKRTIAHLQIVRPHARWWRLAARLVGLLSSDVVVVGTAAHMALAEIDVSSRIVPNAVPFDTTTLQVRSTNSRAASLRLLFAGTFGTRKGGDELLEALAILRRDGIDCNLDIVGREEYLGDEARLLREVEAYGLGGVVRFLGQRSPEELASFYLTRDVFCLPSHLEGLPLALIEAMAYGMPAIATPVGSIEDVVIHGETGLLAIVGDAQSLAEQIHRLADDVELRERLGRNGALHVAAHMAPETVADAWREIYSQVD